MARGEEDEANESEDITKEPDLLSPLLEANKSGSFVISTEN